MNIQAIVELLQLPFMQRAMIGGILAGLTGGLLGSFTILRQLSFFSDALGHSALLGITISLLFGLNPSTLLYPFAVIFALTINYLLQRTRLWTDALLNIVYSSSLAISIIILNFVGRYKGGINNILFGDILAITYTDLILTALFLIICVVFIAFTLRTQMLLTLSENLAIARGINNTVYSNIFIVLLALVVAISIKALGILLVSAFVVIPACTARLLGKSFINYVLYSSALGALSAFVGMLISAALNLPSGPSIVATQLMLFLSAVLWFSVFRP